MPLGDIRPKNILVTKEGEIKMINVASFVDEKTAMDKITENFDNKTKFFICTFISKNSSLRSLISKKQRILKQISSSESEN